MNKWTIGNMFVVEICLTSPTDFNSKFVRNFTQHITTLKSDLYISNIDKHVNAKSILGLLSADIKKDEIIKIQIMNRFGYNQAEIDLKYVIDLFDDTKTF